MEQHDFQEFTQMVDSVSKLLSRGAYIPDAMATAIFFRALAKYSIEEVRAGFDGHVKDTKRGNFVPAPADIIRVIEERATSDRPGEDEAWAMVLDARDEAKTIVWTTEMSAAWAVAKAVMDLGDEVGARMAFKQAYATEIARAKDQRQPVVWSVSLGHDPELRDQALQRAIALGRLPDQRLETLPAPRAALALEWAGDATDGTIKAQAIEGLKRLAEQLRAGRDRGMSADEAAKAETQRKREVAAAQAAAYGRQASSANENL